MLRAFSLPVDILLTHSYIVIVFWYNFIQNWSIFWSFGTQSTHLRAHKFYNNDFIRHLHKSFARSQYYCIQNMYRKFASSHPFDGRMQTCAYVFVAKKWWTIASILLLRFALFRDRCGAISAYHRVQLLLYQYFKNLWILHFNAINCRSAVTSCVTLYALFV